MLVKAGLLALLMFGLFTLEGAAQPPEPEDDVEFGPSVPAPDLLNAVSEIDWGADSSEPVEETLARLVNEEWENDAIYVVPDGLPPLGMDPDTPPRAERPLSIPYTIHVSVVMTYEYFRLYGGSGSRWSTVWSRLYEMFRYTNAALRRNNIAVRLVPVRGRWIRGLDNRRKSMQWLLDYIPRYSYVRTDRDRFKADIIVTVGRNITRGSCGATYAPAWPVPGGSGFVKGRLRHFFHFVVQDGRYNSSPCPRNWANVTFAHEFGHIAGLQHDRVTHQWDINRGVLRGWPGPAYAYGWQQCLVAATIMSYPTACGKLWPSRYRGRVTPLVHLFSSPWKTNTGYASGSRLGRHGTTETYNVNGPVYGARRLQEMIPFIAAYR